MRTLLISIAIGILAFLGAGFISYKYLGQTLSPVVSPATQEIQPTTQQKATTAHQKEVFVTTKAAAQTPTITKSAKGTVIAPGPLRAAIVVQSSTNLDLTTSGVFAFTNAARAQNGNLPALTENVVLDQDAQIKLQDMFTRQYFEHVSPSGDGPAELANKVGYAFVIVGENLALGDFGSDQALLTAWMNSPGHRANILNSNYTELGVAVGKGMYEGRNTWLAVQSFGMPRSACPSIDEQIKATINTNNIAIAALRSQLDAKKAQIDTTSPGDPNYNTYINEYNFLVPEYNSALEANRVSVETYNNQVHSFNACIAAVGTQVSH